jgi:hypothetical protein
MEKTKVKVIDVVEGNFECDTVITNLNGVKTEICFDKKDKVSMFKDKEVYLSKENEEYVITSIDNNKRG